MSVWRSRGPQVRQGLKVFSDWPTYPQFYVGGKLVGGLDVLTEMAVRAGASCAPRHPSARLPREL